MKFKTCLVGACESGKSHFVGKLKNYYHQQYHSTIGIDFCTYKVDKHIIQIWDTSGANRFLSITDTFVEKVKVILAVYKDKESFEWVKKFLKKYQHIEKIIFIHSCEEKYTFESNETSVHFIHCTYTTESVKECIDFLLKIMQEKTLRPSYCFWF